MWITPLATPFPSPSPIFMGPMSFSNQRSVAPAFAGSFTFQQMRCTAREKVSMLIQWARNTFSNQPILMLLPRLALSSLLNRTTDPSSFPPSSPGETMFMDLISFLRSSFRNLQTNSSEICPLLFMAMDLTPAISSTSRMLPVHLMRSFIKVWLPTSTTLEERMRCPILMLPRSSLKLWARRERRRNSLHSSLIASSMTCDILSTRGSCWHWGGQSRKAGKQGCGRQWNGTRSTQAGLETLKRLWWRTHGLVVCDTTHEG
mmetsp:Transcript_50968/g.94426  ORF Transcript_50968/g.94426 Transcript_50968/m.94426 type:complete len:260 (-) Transcript_50968:152-931(-)